MKTLDEVIKAMEYCGQGEDDSNCEKCPYVGIQCCKELCDNSLHYLREYREMKEHLACLDAATLHGEDTQRVNNPALTWKELKQMEGKPVWTVESTVTYDDNGIERIGRWNIIREVTQEHIIFYIGLPYHKSWQGIGWQAYRREWHDPAE